MGKRISDASIAKRITECHEGSLSCGASTWKDQRVARNCVIDNSLAAPSPSRRTWNCGCQKFVMRSSFALSCDCPTSRAPPKSPTLCRSSLAFAITLFVPCLSIGWRYWQMVRLARADQTVAPVCRTATPSFMNITVSKLEHCPESIGVAVLDRDLCLLTSSTNLP